MHCVRCGKEVSILRQERYCDECYQQYMMKDGVEYVGGSAQGALEKRAGKKVQENLTAIVGISVAALAVISICFYICYRNSVMPLMNIFYFREIFSQAGPEILIPLLGGVAILFGAGKMICILGGARQKLSHISLSLIIAFVSVSISYRRFLEFTYLFSLETIQFKPVLYYLGSLSAAVFALIAVLMILIGKYKTGAYMFLGFLLSETLVQIIYQTEWYGDIYFYIGGIVTIISCLVCLFLAFRQKISPPVSAILCLLICAVSLVFYGVYLSKWYDINEMLSGLPRNLMTWLSVLDGGGAYVVFTSCILFFIHKERALLSETRELTDGAGQGALPGQNPVSEKPGEHGSDSLFEADELRRFKELLDAGVITQAEYRELLDAGVITKKDIEE